MLRCHLGGYHFNYFPYFYSTQIHNTHKHTHTYIYVCVCVCVCVCIYIYMLLKKYFLVFDRKRFYYIHNQIVDVEVSGIKSIISSIRFSAELITFVEQQEQGIISRNSDWIVMRNCSTPF
jgi:hypothetical protein